MDSLTVWLSLLTIIFVVQGGLSLYFVNWVLWRWNTLITKINIEHRKDINTDSEE